MSYLKKFSKNLVKRPLITNSITSFIIFGTADCIVQYFEKDEFYRIDYFRAFKQGVIGAALVTPYFHLQYNVIIPQVLKYQGGKLFSLLVDISLTTIFLLSLGFYVEYYSEVLLNASTRKKTNDILRSLLNPIAANWSLFPIPQILLVTIIPPAYKVLFIGLFGISKSSYTSYYERKRNQDLNNKI